MDDKLVAELAFWKEELLQYHRWFAGELELHGQPCPVKNDHLDTVMAWRKEYQEPLYLEQLMLKKDELAGLEVLEVGCGPVSGMSAFYGAYVMAVDPLVYEYIRIGFDIDPKAMRAGIEDLPFGMNSFDAVVAVNSLDHVDDIEKAASEILRVLRPGGKLAFAVDHHAPRICEPVELTDTRMEYLFPGIRKLRQVDERALWRNF